MNRVFKLITIALFMFMFNIKTLAAPVLDTTENYLIEVTNVGEDVMKAYKIVDLYFDTATNTVSYDFTSNFKTYLNSTNGHTPDYHLLTIEQYLAMTGSSTSSGTVPTNSTTLDALMSGYAQYIRANGVSETYNMYNSANTNNGEAWHLAEPGSYLILPSSTSDVYSVMVGNVSKVPDSNNTWDYEGTTINAKKSSPGITKYFYDYRNVSCSGDYAYGAVVVSPFSNSGGGGGFEPMAEYKYNSNKNTLAYNKYENNTLLAYDYSWGTNGANCQYNASFNIGEEYDYIVNVTVPTYPPDSASNRTFTITDSFNDGITFKGISYVTIKDGATTLTIQNGNVKNGNTTIGTISYTGPSNGNLAELEIDLDPTLLTSTNLTIQYTASLNNNAMIGAGNSNYVSLTYSNDPYGSGTRYVEDYTYAYTYAIGVWKYDSEFDDAESPLADYPEPDCEGLSNEACDALWDDWLSDIAEIADITVVSRPSCQQGSSQACDNQWGVYRDYKEDIFAYYQTYNIPNPSNYMLNGATFAIYANSTCTGTPLGTFTTTNQSYPYYVSTGNSGGFDPGNEFYKIDSNKSLAYNNEKNNSKNTLAYLDSSGGDGIGIYEGIKAGTYCIKETVAPTGYRLDQTPHVIQVGDGQSNSLAISNVKQGLLPSTGGIGTYLYMGIGALLVIGSIATVVILNKKKNEA